ncbi:hypothetical protein N7492_006519 [Penicillium capsulatum]|uniref:Uncharacterized protein n=1 Tax=Penicillium capsulatum TaxID=69766 RepID=A0A9W9I0X9_9EURO|nr:hypothetical protein N7492_006519 [Penicillium capsulatum]KAJ6116355.1 hypothetical protein N7512_006080 [Penicillium capsulatum]
MHSIHWFFVLLVLVQDILVLAHDRRAPVVPPRQIFDKAKEQDRILELTPGTCNSLITDPLSDDRRHEYISYRNIKKEVVVGAAWRKAIFLGRVDKDIEKEVYGSNIKRKAEGRKIQIRDQRIMQPLIGHGDALTFNFCQFYEEALENFPKNPTLTETIMLWMLPRLKDDDQPVLNAPGHENNVEIFILPLASSTSGYETYPVN